MILTASPLLFSRMYKLVAACAKRDEVMLDVVSELAPRVDVMNIQIVLAPAALAAPAIPLQYLLTQAFVGLRVKLKPRPSWKQIYPGSAALHI